MASTMANKTEVVHQVCIPMEKNLNYRGIFFDGNPLNYMIPLFMFKFFLIIFISKVLYSILGPLRQPKIVCNILAGLIIGRSVFGRNESYMATIYPEKDYVVVVSIASFGLFFFAFLLCIKIDVAEVARTANKTWKIGLACVVFSFLFRITCIHLISSFLPPELTNGNFPILFSMLSSMSFFIVIVHTLDELNLLSSELGQLSTSVVMLTEAFDFFLMLIAKLISIQGTQHKVYALLGLGGWITFTIFVVRPILQGINDTTPRGQPVKENYVVGVIVWTLFSGMITDALGISYGPAIIVMGLIIPVQSPLGTTIIQKCQLLVFELFFPLLFICIGYYTDLSQVHDWSEFLAFGAIVLVGTLGRLVGCCLVSSSLNIKTNVAILLGLILSLQGVPELTMAYELMSRKHLSSQSYAASVMSVVALNAIITPIIEVYYKAHVSSSELAKSHSRSLGMSSQLGELRIICCVQAEDDVPSMISLLEALNPMDVSPISAYIIHLVSLATQSLPVLAPYKYHNKRRFGKHNESDNIIQAFVNYTMNSQCSIQINPFRMMSPIKYMHEPICRLAEDIRTPLVIVPFFKTQEAIHDNDGSLRILDTNIQSLARCTVGILVDKRLHKMACPEQHFSYNVAVIFLGGADGREALAFAARMSRHPDVSITILKINMVGEGARGFEEEREIDDAFFRDFMAMNVGNAGVVCHELVVENTDEVMSAIHTIESDAYDIVVVGKRQGCNSRFETELLGWAEYPELGVLGDAIAAPDFCGGMMSVLVLQHCDEENQFSRSRR